MGVILSRRFWFLTKSGTVWREFPNFDTDPKDISPNFKLQCSDPRFGDSFPHHLIYSNSAVQQGLLCLYVYIYIWYLCKYSMSPLNITKKKTGGWDPHVQFLKVMFNNHTMLAQEKSATPEVWKKTGWCSLKSILPKQSWTFQIGLVALPWKNLSQVSHHSSS